ncbi:hypothetical protein COV20_05435 [Candidatus Woesearchaeota archaeon CG10_big_fil_rev_8_21_14_0_10_45_16]|nr:MAG: hypothetical protein COV20_05435 [Candidatus Woesearchaeota archaeon CG10_big_fil_rev_8_21_14_0_10_45_16]
MITEHSAAITGEPYQGDVNAKMDVFYNPLMVSNRNVSVVLLNSIPNKNMKLALPLAGSGIRAFRFLKELKKGKIKELYVNDKKHNFNEIFSKNLELNKIDKTKANISNEDATLFMLHQEGFDYIDIDPFGSPNPFLAAAIARISRKGILAITATDTAALTGTYPKVTKRKYWGTSVKNHLMHETGLRILIRKIQLQGIQFEKALTPVLAYHKDHYFRVYFRSEKGKERCDQIIKQHKYLLFDGKTLDFKISDYNKEDGYLYIGPLWAGLLADISLLKKMCKNNPFPEEQKFLEILRDELPVVGFHDIHALAKAYRLEIPKLEGLLKSLKGTRTHFLPTGIKTTKKAAEIIKIIKKS